MRQAAYSVPREWYVTMVAESQRFFKRFFTEWEAYDYAEECGGEVTERLSNSKGYQEIW